MANDQQVIVSVPPVVNAAMYFLNWLETAKEPCFTETAIVEERRELLPAEKEAQHAALTTLKNYFNGEMFLDGSISGAIDQYIEQRMTALSAEAKTRTAKQVKS